MPVEVENEIPYDSAFPAVSHHLVDYYLKPEFESKVLGSRRQPVNV